MSAMRMVWLAAMIVVLAIATFFVAKRYWLGREESAPGIIFERADRPAKA